MISVIVPVYNVENYIKSCIESLLFQTYSDLEIILVDDGSTDDSGKICDRYERQDNRIRVIHKKNGGLSDARNKGLDVANGDFIGFVDGDDLIHPKMFEILLYNSLKYDAEISACVIKRVSSIFDEKIENDINIYDQKVKLLKREDSLKNIDIISVCACNKLYKRKMFKEIRYPVGKFHEDEFVIHELFFQSKKIVVTDQVLYYYIQRENSIMSAYNINKLYDAMEAYRKRIEFSKEKWQEVLPEILCNYSEYVKGEFFNNESKLTLENKKLLRNQLKKVLNENKKIKIPYKYRIFCKSIFIYEIYDRLIWFLKRF